MSEEYRYVLGTFEGKKHLLFCRVTPDFNQPDEFVVNVSYRTYDFMDEDFKNIQIVRIDNKGKPLHLDELWKEGKPKRFLNWRGSKRELFYRALEKIQEDWKRYAKKWKKNKGYKS